MSEGELFFDFPKPNNFLNMKCVTEISELRIYNKYMEMSRARTKEPFNRQNEKKQKIQLQNTKYSPKRIANVLKLLQMKG